jgi:hypothetical protein
MESIDHLFTPSPNIYGFTTLVKTPSPNIYGFTTLVKTSLPYYTVLLGSSGLEVLSISGFGSPPACMCSALFGRVARNFFLRMLIRHAQPLIILENVNPPCPAINYFGEC